MDLQIRRLTLADEDAFAESGAAWDTAGGFNWPQPAAGESFADWLQQVRNEEAGIELRAGRVPATLLLGFVEEKIVACTSVRHRLSEAIATVGGHVGYAVLPAFRRRGIAVRMLQSALEECRRRGIEKALLTCRESNAGSRRTIEKCGGVLENVHRHAEDGELYRRYWIDVSG